MKSFLFLGLMTTVVSTMCLRSFAAEELKFSSGVSPMANILSLVTAPFEKETGIKIVYMNKDPKGIGGDQVFKDVDSGLAEAGAGGAVWEDWLKLMDEKKYTIQHLKDFKSRVLGKDRIQFMTYKDGPKKLSQEQIEGLLTGAITNWKQAGGADVPVQVFLSTKQPNTEKFLNERVLKGGKKVKQEGAKVIDADITEMVRQVGSTKGGFGFGPINVVTAEVNLPEQPVIGRPITFIWRGAPSKNLQSLFDFITKKGKDFGVVQ